MSNLRKKLSALKQERPITKSDIQKAMMFWMLMKSLYKEKFKDFGEADDNNPILRQWALHLREFSLEEIQQIPQVLVAECPWPPQLPDFLKMINEDKDIEIDELYIHALECARKQKYNEAHQWKSAAQRYAMSKVTLTSACDNDRKARRNFTYYYEEGLALERQGKLQQYAQLTHMAANEPADWTENQSLNRMHINRIKRILKKEDDLSHNDDFNKQVKKKQKSFISAMALKTNIDRMAS